MRVLRCQYPVMQIRTWGLLAYDRKEFDGKSEVRSNQSRERIVSYTGKMTTYSRKKIKRAIQLIVATAKDKEATHFKSGKAFKFKLNFITLTLPALQGEITDKAIKVCLDNWIKRAKRKHNLKSYVWRAERQKNGNIHFHMITDTYIRYDHIRNDWNSVLGKTGLVKKYQDKNGQKQPNSTDVHAIHKVRNLSQYFIKYMSKDHKEGEEPISGKIWDCSANLKTKANCELQLEGETLAKWNELYSEECLDKITDANFTLIFIPPDKFILFFTPAWLAKWEEYLTRIRNDHS